MISIAPLPPEKCAYALARYSRSPDPVADSIEWVRTHDSRKFLESFYFQYGHASIADLGHVVMCFEGISELAATEVEDEQLWDGQARSSRYQDFGKSGFITPPELDAGGASRYQRMGERLIAGYQHIHERVAAHLSERLPRPETMKPDAYQRNIAARAFDVARYLLFFGVPTGVGQITSIRTLEKQIRRLKASAYEELRSLGGEIAVACSEPARVGLYGSSWEPLAPTLAKYVDADPYPARAAADLAQWAAANLPPRIGAEHGSVDLVKPLSAAADIAATLLYPVTDRPFRELYELAASWPEARRNEVIGVAMQSRTARDELLRNFRHAPYAFDIVMDIGAYRDLHRHRRCQQFRQAYSPGLGFDTPQAIKDAGLANMYEPLVAEALACYQTLPASAGDYVLPFATRSRFLFKMDFAEADYIARLRSGVKGHFSYRKVAWEMKQAMEREEPELARWMNATPPWIEDPLQR